MLPLRQLPYSLITEALGARHEGLGSTDLVWNLTEWLYQQVGQAQRNLA